MCCQVKKILLDKTGTVTYGTPMVSRLCLFVDDTLLSMSQILCVVGTAEINSEHPIASGTHDTVIFSFFLFILFVKLAPFTLGGLRDPQMLPTSCFELQIPFLAD